MKTGSSAIPPVVLAYGLLGVVPFLAPPLAGVAFPAFKHTAAFVLALYGGLILSFLGGARWGFANTRTPPNPLVISMSMLPTLVALAVLVALPGVRSLQLLLLAAALILHWLWDLRGEDLPAWYASLRTLLTAGAVAGLVAGAIMLR